MHVLALPGILHVLLDETVHPFPEDSAESFHADLRARLGLTQEACVGLIWYGQTEKTREQEIAIRPLVHVRGTGTTVLENSCGSGSLALALMRGDREIRILQPCGSVLTVSREASDLAVVSGTVTLVTEGTVWIDRAE